MLSPESRGALRQGFRVWSDRLDGAEVRFLGRGPVLGRQESLALVEGEAPPVATLRQVHSARVVDAAAGSCGEGDALVATGEDLALSVITADCVPILLAGEDDVLLAIHAGWRGIVAGVVAAALERLPHPSTAHAWLGPAIGPCCYEVGPEVAEAVGAAAGSAALAPGVGGEHPHLDLQQAVVAQLARGGVLQTTRLDLCTRCHPELLWSYRRDGARAGRNLAFIWRRTQG